LDLSSGTCRLLGNEYVNTRRIVADFTPRLLDDQNKIYARTCKIGQDRNFFSQDKTGGESCLYCCDPEMCVNSRISQGFKMKSSWGLAAKGIGVIYMLTAGREEQIRMY